MRGETAVGQKAKWGEGPDNGVRGVNGYRCHRSDIRTEKVPMIRLNCNAAQSRSSTTISSFEHSLDEGADSPPSGAKEALPCACEDPTFANV
ncbi:hypothetical protein CRI94_06295 [Longibacter salinarum]|uniref:Uncharacterized protein n=1 Tax=Longibacter salinarum TaxID=1850348 RepID=A0A2A8D1V8_9BACT|nr:hypothetical protein CRI94_06295 [Longibacter salinarum]